MNVVRLKAWFSRLLAPLAAAWRQRVRVSGGTNDGHAERGEQALVTATVAHPYRAGLASGTWLEDARRLRARPLSRLGSAAPSREHIHQILHDPHWAAAYSAAQPDHYPRTKPSNESQETERHTRRGEPASRPLASSARQESPQDSPRQRSDDRESPSLSSPRERRRLVYVRELVRRGIYNEGFTPGSLPDQYRAHPDHDAGTGPGPLPLDD